ncbi:protein argonaute 2-like [Capsicum annuum]|uniref:protein argonaute 2-like n=1 Tax=Capsicum annuum TaxID=4072 RepID=UPI001FB0F1F5|nr:protein argonaute 2-like [Capsicum annuum]
MGSRVLVERGTRVGEERGFWAQARRERRGILGSGTRGRRGGREGGPGLGLGERRVSQAPARGGEEGVSGTGVMEGSRSRAEPVTWGRRKGIPGSNGDLDTGGRGGGPGLVYRWGERRLPGSGTGGEKGSRARAQARERGRGSRVKSELGKQWGWEGGPGLGRSLRAWDTGGWEGILGSCGAWDTRGGGRGGSRAWAEPGTRGGKGVPGVGRSLYTWDTGG